MVLGILNHLFGKTGKSTTDERSGAIVDLQRASVRNDGSSDTVTDSDLSPLEPDDYDERT
jgi:hypothetical protein